MSKSFLINGFTRVINCFTFSQTVAIFQEESKGGKGLHLPSILEETRVLEKYLGIFVDYTCFS